jgi:hypothetical protein
VGHHHLHRGARVAMHAGQTRSTLTRLLGALLWDYWDIRQGVSASPGVTSWVSRVRGVNFAPIGVPNQPTLVVDGVYFKGRPVVQCEAAGDKALVADYGANWAAVTDRPCFLVVGRNRNVSPTDQYICTSSDGIGATSMAFSMRARTLGLIRASNGVVPIETPYDLLPHTWCFGVDGSNVRMRTDGVEATPVAGAGNSTYPHRKVTVGTRSDGTFSRDFNAAAVILLLAWPAPALLSATESLARSIWI